MKNEIDRALRLLGDFEKQISILSGVNSLSEALLILADVADTDDKGTKTAENLITTYKKIVLKSANKLLSTPEKFSDADFDYWHTVLEVMNCNIRDDDELLLLQSSIAKLKKKARWESLSVKQQDEEIYRLLIKLPKEKRDDIIRSIFKKDF